MWSPEAISRNFFRADGASLDKRHAFDLYGAVKKIWVNKLLIRLFPCFNVEAFF